MARDGTCAFVAARRSGHDTANPQHTALCEALPYCNRQPIRSACNRVVISMLGQRQIYSQTARTAEEANRRNAHVVTNGSIWVGNDEIGWIENGNVFSLATELEFATRDESGNLHSRDNRLLRKFATLDENGTLYSLDGQSLNLRIETVNGGGRIGAESHPDAIARFRNLASGSES